MVCSFSLCYIPWCSWGLSWPLSPDTQCFCSNSLFIPSFLNKTLTESIHHRAWWEEWQRALLWARRLLGTRGEAGRAPVFFFLSLQSILFLLTLSGSPTPLPSSVAEVSLIKWDRHQWHFLLPLHQVNLCFDQFVYKLADQIFAYYKAMAGRYESSALWPQTFLRLPPGRQDPLLQNLPSSLAPKGIWMIAWIGC